MADTIFYGGEIITMDEKTTHSGKVEALAVSGDAIIEVGSIEQVFRRKGPKTQMILLNGQTLMPGFIEPHQHAIMCCLSRAMYTNISGVNYRSYAEVSAVMKDTLQSIANAKNDKWAVFLGWDPELVQDLPALSCTLLDQEFSRDIPIYVVGQSGHTAWANTIAFTKSDINANTPQPDGGTFVKDEEGNLTGQMFEAGAMLPVLVNAGSPTPEEIKAAIAGQFQYYASAGFTTVTDLGYIPNPDVDPFVKQIADNQCPIRLGLYRMTNPVKDPSPDQSSQKKTTKKSAPKIINNCCNSGIFLVAAKKLKTTSGRQASDGGGIGNYNAYLWEVGIKIVQDGSPHCGTAAYREPFMSTPLCMFGTRTWTRSYIESTSKPSLYRMTNPVKDPSPDQSSQKKTTKKSAPKIINNCCNSGIFLVAAKKLKTTSGRQASDGGGIGNYNAYLWEVGIKIVQDGSPHCGTAAYREPFMSTPLTENLGFPAPPQYGILNFSTEALHDTINKLHLQGKQVAIHTHGERACEEILKVYEQILTENGDTSNKNRLRMEHCGMMTVEQIARAGKINIALSFFVDHLRFYAKVYKTDIFGDRVNRWTPLSEATKNGVTWTIHQDHPTFPGEASPFANMKTAVTRCHRDDPGHPYGPEYRVPIHEALKSYTVNAAWQLHLDNQVGTITQGKKADLVILSDNPYLKDPFKLEEIKVVETFIGGRRNNIGKMTTLAPGINVLKRDPKFDAY